MEFRIFGRGLVLEINYRGYHGRGTKDILGDQRAGGLKKRPKQVIIYVIFAIFAFCGRGIEVYFSDRGRGFLTTKPNMMLTLAMIEFDENDE